MVGRDSARLKSFGYCCLRKCSSQSALQDPFHRPVYESSLRAGHGWRESLHRHQGCFEASDCGRLGRQAAGHPWSALRVVKSCRKDCPTASVLPKPKQQVCIQSGTRAHYLNYLQEVGEAGKRSAGNRIGYQVIDRQVETRPMSAGTQADRAAS